MPPGTSRYREDIRRSPTTLGWEAGCRTLKLLRCSARAETFEGFLAKYIGVALAGLRKLNDTLGDNVVGLIVCICKPKRDPSHLECDSHDALSLSVEFGVVV